MIVLIQTFICANDMISQMLADDQKKNKKIKFFLQLFKMHLITLHSNLDNVNQHHN